MTGRDAFERADALDSYVAGAVPALRVLWDLGEWDTGAPREVRFKLDGTTKPVAVLRDRFVAMTAGAASSGSRSNVQHGRFDDGLTVSFDLVLPTFGIFGTDGLPTAIRKDVMHWFLVKAPVFDGPTSQWVRAVPRPVGKPRLTEDEVAEKARRKAERIATEIAECKVRAAANSPADELSRHCGCCGDSESGTIAWSSGLVDAGRTKVFLCYSCFLLFERCQRYTAKTPFDRFMTCAAECACMYRTDFRMGDRLTAPDAAVERAALAQRTEATDDLHCWHCGTALAAFAKHYCFSEYVRPSDDCLVLLCNGCMKLRKSGYAGERLALCPADSCPGCVKPEESSSSSEEEGPPSPPQLAREQRHCYYCGVDIDLFAIGRCTNPAIVLGPGVRPVLCLACKGKLLRHVAGADVRVATCPEDECRGCIFLESAIVRPPTWQDGAQRRSQGTPAGASDELHRFYCGTREMGERWWKEPMLDGDGDVREVLRLCRICDRAVRGRENGACGGEALVRVAKCVGHECNGCKWKK